ncbi:MAG: transcription termination/antitermination NusG family protein [Terriglobales bacterium]
MSGTEKPEVCLLELIPTAPEAASIDCNSASQAWLAAYTRPRHEQKVAEYFLQHRWQVFLPTHSTWRYWSDRRKLVRLPLFSSYVFVKLNDSERRRAVQAPGVMGWVRGAFGPARVDEDELRAIAKLLQSGLAFDPLPTVEIGDEVEIAAGALRGCRGRLLRKDQGAIALLISAINGGVRVNLPDPTWIRPLPRPARATAQGA